MVDLTAKIFLFPALLYLVSHLLPGLRFATITQTLLTGLLLAVLSAAADHWFLNKIKNNLSTLLDWSLTAFLIWVVGLLMPGTEITLFGAIIFAVVIAVAEYIAHIWLLKNHMW